MNKQELIERIEGLKNLFGNKAEYIEIDAAIKLIEQLDEPQKPVVPQFVADWYEENKDDFEIALFQCIDHIPSVYDEGDLNEFEEWIIDVGTKPFQTLVNMHQFDYEVEKEKRYLVKMKGISVDSDYLNYDSIDDEWYLASDINGCNVRTHHTRKELEEAGFGWVFDCPGIEIEEVTE
nr:MAG TPA: Protein of unknown function (DUF1642) [Caudoviricetes sp.]